MGEEEVRSIIEAKARDRIETYLEQRERWNFARSLTNLTNETAHEYGDRFLFELIQNAYDAHPPQRSDGIVHVVLDETEGPSGVLYVGNSGNAFTLGNFEALSNLAQSDKLPGEGIGNKGIGFRSVLQVCDDPEVFSTSQARSAGDPADGFCFGFAKEADLRRLTRTADDFDAVSQDLTRYLLPVPVDPTSARVTRLLDCGCVTVVRLPLKGNRALESAREQLEIILGGAPLMLFLDRLQTLEVARVLEDETEDRTCIERTTRTVEGLQLPSTVSVERVSLQEEKFLIFRQVVACHEIRTAVEESIETGTLSASWSKWELDAEVAVAVACDFESALTPAMFTFLPMGSRMAAPFHGFLNAPFYTKLARVDLDEAVPLNSYLLDRAADLCVVAIGALKNSELLDRFTAACDLLVWDRTHLERLKGAFGRTGTELAKAPVVPAVEGQDATDWHALAEVFAWDQEGLELLDAGRVSAEAGVPILLPSLGTERRERLNDLRQSLLDEGMDPSDEIVADWVEEVAKHLANRSFDAADWNAFYRDLHHLFRSKDGTLLQRRKVLVDSRHRCLPAGPWDEVEGGGAATAVFFPPRRRAEQGSVEDEAVEDEEDIDVPARLRRAITYLHGDIALTKQEGSRRSRNEVRDFLEGSRLVAPYRKRVVVDHVAHLLSRSNSERTHREALLWAFRQFEATKGDVRDLKRLPLRVPTASGWIAAPLASFGPGWPKTRGRDLGNVLEALRATDEYARELDSRLVEKPDSWVSDPTKIDTWTSFLDSIGVKDGLFPLTVSVRRVEMDGRLYTPRRVADELKLDGAIADQWESALGEGRQASSAEHPYTPYRNSSEVWVLPGQRSYTELSRGLRALFAELVVESVGAWPEECLEFTFERFRSSDHRRYPDTQRWPSPAWSFVAAVPWVPMADPRRRSEAYFADASQAWHHDDSGRETAPRFASLVPIEFRRRIERSSKSLERLLRAGLRVWNDPSSAWERLSECADLIAGGHLTEGDASGVRRACRDAWHDLRAREHDLQREDIETLPLVVSRGHDLAVVNPAEDGDESSRKLFVPASSRGVVAQVLEGLEANILEVDAQDGGFVENLLSSRADLAISPIDRVEARYIADGHVVAPGPELPLLIPPEHSWLVDVLLAVLDLQGSQFVRVTEQTLRRAGGKFRRARVWWASSLDVEVDGEVVDLPSHAERSVAIDDMEDPLIVTSGSDRALNWAVLESLSSSLAELVGNRAAARDLAFACVRIARVLHGEWQKPTDSEIADALQLPIERVSASLASIRQDLALAIHKCAAVVAHFEGTEAARSLLAEAIEDEEGLIQALGSTANLPIPAAELVRISRSTTELGEIRRTLDIDFAGFNATMRSLGPPFSPIVDVEHHDQVLQHFVSTNRTGILDSLRERFREEFTADKPLDEYLALSKLDRFTVPDDWPETYETPPDELMTDLVNSWLRACGAPQIGAGSGALDDLDALRRRNESFLATALPKIRGLLTAWYQKHGEEVPGGWLAEEEAGQSPQSYLRASGRLDFVQVSEDRIIGWLAEGSYWPAGMPRTVVLEDLGLDDEALDQGRREQETRDADERLAARSVLIDGEQVGASQANYQEIVSRVHGSLTDSFLNTSKRTSSLADIGQVDIASSGKGGGGGRARRDRLTKEQKAAVGFVGEVLAYEWLRSRYSEEVTPDSWVSGYRSAALGGHEGDDGLGYDFEVVQKSQTLIFEVKTTSTDACEFLLTESELRAAQVARGGTYRIVFVRNALDSDLRTLHVLPNPFDVQGRDKYRVMNEGLRYRFDLGTGEKGE